MFIIGYYVTKTTANGKKGPTSVVNFGFNPLFEKNRVFQLFNMKLFHIFHKFHPEVKHPKVIFLRLKLCSDDEACFFATCTTLSSLCLLLCAVRTGSSCLYVLRCVCNPEVVCYTVMQRHEAQSCKQLRHTTPRKTTHTRRSSCTSAETCSSQTDQQRECACVLIRHHVRLTRLCPLRGRAFASVPPRHRQERLQSGLQ